MSARSLFFGSLGLLAAALVGCGEAGKPAESTPPAATVTPVTVAATPPADSTGGLVGKLLYKQHCVLCHGINGDKCLYSARNLQESTLPLATRIATVRLGRGKMPAFAPRLSEEQIEAVARYSMTLFKHPPADSAAARKL